MANSAQLLMGRSAGTAGQPLRHPIGALNNGSGLRPETHHSFAALIMNMQFHGHIALSAALCKRGERKGEQGQRPARSAAPSASLLCCTRQSLPSRHGRNEGLGSWRDLGALQTLVVARFLHPCPVLPQQAAHPLLFTITVTLPQQTQHGHSSACTPQLPAPNAPCTPMCPLPPVHLPSLWLPESGFPSPGAGAGRKLGGCVSGCQGRVAFGCTLKHVLGEKAGAQCPPRTLCSCLHGWGSLTKRPASHRHPAPWGV